jgi:hypothetical protein
MRFLTTLANIPATHYSLVFPVMYIVMIFGLSSIPGSPPARDHVWLHWILGMLQNSLHIPLFAGLTWLFRWSLTAVTDNKRLLIFLAFILTVGYGIFDEWHQSFTPYRTSSFSDVMLDITGAILALWLFSKCTLAKDNTTHINYRLP